MWGPLVSFRRRWRPQPTVGQVFLCRIYHSERTGEETDVGVRDPNPERALATLRQRLAEIGSTDIVIDAMRPADARDLRQETPIKQLTEWRQFGEHGGYIGDPAYLAFDAFTIFVRL